MDLPERAARFLSILHSFASDPLLGEFRRGASTAFLGDDPELEEDEDEYEDEYDDDDDDDDEIQDLLDYLLFSHRDGSGRSLIHHFLAARGDGLAPGEREVFERFGESVYGVFDVTAVEPGRGFTLRRSGSGERFEVVEVEGSRGLEPGMGVITRLVPYRGHHEATGVLRSVSQEVAYLIARITARAGEAAARQMMSPPFLRRILQPLRHRRGKKPAPPESRLEAELHAAAVFAETGFPFSVEETQRRFQTMESFVGLLQAPGLRLSSKEDLQRLADALLALWNHTPREELGGLSPVEKAAASATAGRPLMPRHLLEDLKNEVLARVDPTTFPDEESRRAAVQALQAEWLTTPQKELGGRAPRDVIGGSPPDLEEELRALPADRLAWSPERIGELLASREPVRTLWALQWVAAHRAPVEAAAVLSAVSYLLEHPDEDVVSRALGELDEFAGHSLASEVAAAIAARIPFLGEGSEDHRLALETLSLLAPAEHAAVFAAGLELGVDKVTIAALGGVIASRTAEAPFIIVAAMVGSTSVAPALIALLGLCRLRSVELVERCAQLFLGLFSSCQDDDTASVDELCLLAQETLGIDSGLFMAVESAMYPEDEEVDAAASRPSVFLPREDASAARRGDEVLSPERMERLFALCDAGSTTELRELLGALTLEAIARAIAENAGFEPLGEILACLTRSILSWDGFGDLDREEQQVIASVLGTFLAKAIRGRDISQELEEAGSDRSRLLELCRVDEAWVDGRTLGLLARALRVEDLEPLSRSADSAVSERARILLAAIEPGRRLGDVLDLLRRSSGLMGPLSDRLTLLGGFVDFTAEAVLAPLVKASRSGLERWAPYLLGKVTRLLGTERARLAVECCLDLWLGQEAPDTGLLETALAVGSRPAAEAMIAALRAGSCDLESLSYDDWDLEALGESIEACLKVFDLPGDAQEILSEGWEKSGGVRREGYGDEDDDEDGYEDEDEEVGGGLLGHLGRDWATDPDDPEALHEEPIDPIVRDTPKVGRNDPCPCGSGKKHKKCCGKGR